jgi:hypothetical protein
MKKITLAMLTMLALNTSANAQTFSWAKQLGSTTGSASNWINQSITVDGSGNVYTIGTFSGTLDFDPGAGVTNVTSSSSGTATDLYVSKVNSSGSLVWLQKLDNVSHSFKGITIDAAANVYIGGTFSGTVDFDPGAGSYPLTSAGGDDAFIAKLNSTGGFVWAQRFGGAGTDNAKAVAVDGNGNVCLTGAFSGTVDFSTDANNPFVLSAAGGSDAYILKVDALGNFSWVTTVSTASADFGQAVRTDAAGNVYSMGKSSGMFIQKQDPSGNVIWSNITSTTSLLGGNAMALDASGNIYTCGDFNHTVDFDPGAGVYNLVSVDGSTGGGSGPINNDIFIQKLDNSGNFVWAKQITGPGFENAFSIAIDAFSNVYTTGYFSGGTAIYDFDPGPGTYGFKCAGLGNGWVLKLNSSGNFVWASQFAGKLSSESSNGHGIAVSGTGVVYTTGDFGGKIDFDPSANKTYLTSVGSGNNLFLQKMTQANNGARMMQAAAEGSDNALVLYPNPTQGSFAVRCGIHSTEETATLEVSDLTGRVVFRKKVEVLSGEVNEAFQIQGLNAGTYILTVTTAQDRLIEKLLIK